MIYDNENVNDIIDKQGEGGAVGGTGTSYSYDGGSKFCHKPSTTRSGTRKSM